MNETVSIDKPDTEQLGTEEVPIWRREDDSIIYDHKSANKYAKYIVAFIVAIMGTMGYTLGIQGQEQLIAGLVTLGSMGTILWVNINNLQSAKKTH